MIRLSMVQVAQRVPDGTVPVAPASRAAPLADRAWSVGVDPMADRADAGRPRQAAACRLNWLESARTVHSRNSLSAGFPVNALSSSIAKRPVALFALAMLLAVALSSLTTIAGSPLTAVWLPTAVVLVGLLSRGRTVLLPAALGLAGAMWLFGMPITRMPGAIAAAVVAPVICASVITRLRAKGGQVSHLVQTLQMLAAITLVQAPIAAALMSLDTGITTPGPVSGASLFFLHWIIEATTGVVFVRGLLTWMPNDGGGFCPIAGIKGVRHRFDRDLVVPFTLFASLLITGAAATQFGLESLARVMSLLVFACVAITSITLGRRSASTMMMIACLAIFLIRLVSAPLELDVVAGGNLLLIETLLLFGFGLCHVLNALSEERLRQQRDLHRQAFTNESSGLPNLRALSEFVQGLGRRRPVVAGGVEPSAVPAGGRGIVLAEISVAGLQHWADLAGRTSVMRLEPEIGSRLRDELGAHLLHLSHVGTGRFIMVLDAAVRSDQVAGALQAVFDLHRFAIDGHLIKLSWSVGMVDCPDNQFELETALASLSIAQQLAVAGNGRLCRMTLDDDRVRSYRAGLAWMEKVRQMLADDRLRLFAQPIAPAQAGVGNALHFEVLARMLGDDGSILTPDRFLPAITRAGLHIEFDQAVIRKTLAHLAQHPALADATDLVAVNVTGPTICDAGFARFVLATMKQHGTAADQLVIEITESDSIADLDAALENVGALRAAGVRIAVDDFGTGQATFDYIRRLRPDLLKIDGSFVRRYLDSPLDQEIVESIVRLAQAVGARSVAEFAESEQIVQRMALIGVDFVQGYAIARPMPIERIMDGREWAATRPVHPDRSVATARRAGEPVSITPDSHPLRLSRQPG